MSEAALDGQNKCWVVRKKRKGNTLVTVSIAVINLMGERKTNCKVFNCMVLAVMCIFLYIRMVGEHERKVCCELNDDDVRLVCGGKQGVCAVGRDNGAYCKE